MKDIIFIIITLLFCQCGVLSKISNEEVKTKTEEVKLEVEESKIQTLLSYEDIKNKKDSLTDFQFTLYLKPHLGKYVSWSGFVKEVKEDVEGIVLHVDMEKYSKYSSTDVSALILPEMALSLKRRQKIFFEGKLTYGINSEMPSKIRIENLTLIDKK